MVNTTYTIRLANEDVQVERMPKPLGELKLDPRNQRIQFQLRVNGKDPQSVSQEEILELLWDVEGDYLKRLYNAVYEYGGLIYPLVVRSDGTIIEGNCRYAVLTKLCQDYPGNPRFCSPECEVLPETLTEEQRGLYLGEAHVAGKQKWDAFEIAEHLYRMHHDLNKTLEFLSTHLRLSKTTVQKRIEAYGMTMDFLTKYPEPGNIYKFSYFEEFQKKKPLRDRLRIDPGFRDKFARWVATVKLTRGEQVRQLPELLQDPELEQILDQEGFPAADKRRQEKLPEFREPVYQALDRAAQQLGRLPITEIERLRDGHSAEAKLLRELYKGLKRVSELAGINLAE